MPFWRSFVLLAETTRKPATQQLRQTVMAKAKSQGQKNHQVFRYKPKKKSSINNKQYYWPTISVIDRKLIMCGLLIQGNNQEAGPMMYAASLSEKWRAMGEYEHDKICLCLEWQPLRLVMLSRIRSGFCRFDIGEDGRFYWTLNFDPEARQKAWIWFKAWLSLETTECKT